MAEQKLEKLINTDGIYSPQFGNLIIEAMNEDDEFHKSANKLYRQFKRLQSKDDELSKAEMQGIEMALMCLTGYCFKTYEKAVELDCAIGWTERC